VSSSDGIRMIDADGHVLEQLDLPPDVMDMFLSRIIGDSPPTAEDPAPTE